VRCRSRKDAIESLFEQYVPHLNASYVNSLPGWYLFLQQAAA
jgi:hypothetical protein